MTVLTAKGLSHNAWVGRSHLHSGVGVWSRHDVHNRSTHHDGPANTVRSRSAHGPPLLPGCGRLPPQRAQFRGDLSPNMGVVLHQRDIGCEAAAVCELHDPLFDAAAMR